MFRTLRALSPLHRSLIRSRSYLVDHESSVRIRRVRVVQSVFTLKRAQTLSFWAIAIGGYLLAVGSVVDKEEEVEIGQVKTVKLEEKQKAQVDDIQGEEGEGQEVNEEDVVIPDETSEDAWFIPLGWPRECPQTYYRGTDPEWQSFVEFAKDRKRGLSLRNELAGMVGLHVAQSREFQKSLGTPMKTGKYWLDIDFPSGPPPEFERGGLEITDDYIAWTIRPVSPINKSRLHNVLWPKPMLSSVWASYKLLWSFQIAKVKSLLNIKSETAPTTSSTPPKFINLHRLIKTEDKKSSNKTSPAVMSTETKTPTLGTSQPSTKSESEDSSKLLRGLPTIPQTSPQTSTEITSALLVFMRTLEKTWRPALDPIPRGTFLVSGFVEVSGPKGHCVMDVHASYHPAENRWVLIAAGVRRMQPRKQGPKGGR